MSWGVFIESAQVRHVIPLDDYGEHIDASEEKEYPMGPHFECKCPCCPRWEYKDGICIFIHSSFDGREALEWANEILSK